MLTHHRRPVCLSLISTDLPIWSTVETAATLYQKDDQRFHLLLNDAELPTSKEDSFPPQENNLSASRLLWLEISPYRVIMTLQENGKLGYRHFWEEGVYGISRYWLHTLDGKDNSFLRLRNYTRKLTLEGHPLPERLRVDYELWSNQVQLGHYVLNLEIHH